MFGGQRPPYTLLRIEQCDLPGRQAAFLWGRPQVAAFEGEVGVLAAAEGAREVEAAGDLLDAGVLGKAQGLGQELGPFGCHDALKGPAGVVAEEVAGQGSRQFLEELAGDARPHDERAYGEGGCAG